MGLGTRVGGAYYETALDTSTAVQNADQLAATIKRTGDSAEQAFGATTQRGINATADSLTHASTTGRETIRVVDALTNRFQVFGPDGPILRDMADFGVHFARLTGHLGDDSAVVQAIGAAGAKAGAIYAAAMATAANLGAGLAIIWSEAASAGGVIAGVKAAASAAGILYGQTWLGAAQRAINFGALPGGGGAPAPGGTGPVGPTLLGGAGVGTFNVPDTQAMFERWKAANGIASYQAGDAGGSQFAAGYLDAVHRDMDKQLLTTAQLDAEHASELAKKVLDAQNWSAEVTRRWGELYSDDRVSRLEAAAANAGKRTGTAFVDAVAAVVKTAAQRIADDFSKGLLSGSEIGIRRMADMAAQQAGVPRSPTSPRP